MVPEAITHVALFEYCIISIGVGSVGSCTVHVQKYYTVCMWLLFEGGGWLLSSLGWDLPLLLALPLPLGWALDVSAGRWAGLLLPSWCL